MSAPVDVLAVLDRLIGNARTMAGLSGDPLLRENLRDGEKSRAAVAELIEAAISARSQLRAAAEELRLLSISFQDMHCDAISDHLDAAISGVQGVQS